MHTNTRTSKRKRRDTTTSKCLAPQLRAELFDWFIDYSTLIKSRISSETILKHARVLKNKLEEVYAGSVRDGLLDEASVPKLPILNGVTGKSWLRGWRHQYGVTLRTVNLRYKCSRTVLFQRLAILGRIS